MLVCNALHIIIYPWCMHEGYGSRSVLFVCVCYRASCYIATWFIGVELGVIRLFVAFQTFVLCVFC